jgi:hypothetical protein
MVKNNKSLIMRLVVTHMAMSIFGLLMGILGAYVYEKGTVRNEQLVIVKEGSNALTYIVGAVVIITYIMILYVNFWELGAADKIKIDGGREELNPWKGLLVSLAANSPTIVFGIFATLNAYIPNGFFGSMEMAQIYYNSMYSCLISGYGLDLAVKFPPVYMLLAVPALVTSMVSYILGVKGFKCLFPEPKKVQERNME